MNRNRKGKNRKPQLVVNMGIVMQLQEYPIISYNNFRPVWGEEKRKEKKALPTPLAPSNM